MASRGRKRARRETTAADDDDDGAAKTDSRGSQAEVTPVQLARRRSLNRINARKSRERKRESLLGRVEYLRQLQTERKRLDTELQEMGLTADQVLKNGVFGYGRKELEKEILPPDPGPAAGGGGDAATSDPEKL